MGSLGSTTESLGISYQNTRTYQTPTRPTPQAVTQVLDNAFARAVNFLYHALSCWFPADQAPRHTGSQPPRRTQGARRPGSASLQPPASVLSPAALSQLRGRGLTCLISHNSMLNVSETTDSVLQYRLDYSSGMARPAGRRQLSPGRQSVTHIPKRWGHSTTCRATRGSPASQRIAGTGDLY